jgi:hypothetical protein
VVAIASVRQRRYGCAAILTVEALILGSPADGSASGLKKRSSIGVQGSVSLLRPRPGLCYPAGRSQAWRGRGTDSPPVPPRQGSAITSASCIHRGLSHPADPYLDRVCSTVPVTVSRASSAASGRCHPVRTGVGVRPLASEPESERCVRCLHSHLPARRRSRFQQRTRALATEIRPCCASSPGEQRPVPSGCAGRRSAGLCGDR